MPMSKHGAMVTASLPFMPRWRGDETLYSWCAGMHRLHMLGSAKRTGEKLFDAVHAPRLIEIPSRLDTFVARTGGRLGSTGQVLSERTVFPYLSCLLPLAQRATAELAASSRSHAAAARVRLGLVSNRGSPAIRLKDCILCNRESGSLYGMATWRLEHQLPLAMVCLLHGQPLRVHHTRASTWRIPTDTDAGDRQLAWDNRREAGIASTFSRLELCFHRSSGRCLQDGFRSATLQALARIGVIKPHLRLDVRQVATWLEQSMAFAMVGRLFDWAPPPDAAERLLKARSIAGRATWSVLWAAIVESEPAAEAWIAQAFAGGLGPAQLSLALDETKAGTDVPANLEEILWECKTIEEIALRLRVSKATVNRWLTRSRPMLRRWQEARRASRQEEAIRRIRRFMELHPQSNRAEVLRQCKTDVALLQANVPEALWAILRSIPSDRTPQLQLALEG